MDKPPLYIPTSQYLHQRYSVWIFHSVPWHPAGMSHIPSIVCVSNWALVNLRSSPIFAGISRLKMEFKLSLYAVDLLLYVSDPTCSISAIISFFQRFGSFSGYKVNVSKSECFPINTLALQLNQSDIPFKLSPSGFKYLGINVTRELTNLFSANFTPLQSKIMSDLQRWRNLPLSPIGRINSVKINILPKFLFLFNCLPLFLPNHFFKTIDQDISWFLWCGKAPRIRYSVLQRCKFNGGLSLPNFQRYYWAAHIHKISFRLKSADPPMVQIRGTDMRLIFLISFTYLFYSNQPLWLYKKPSGMFHSQNLVPV